VGAIPTNDRAACVFVSVPPVRLRYAMAGDPLAAYRRWLREAAPEIGALTDAATPLEPVRGFGGHAGFIKASTGPGWALVGDAAYFKDPLTAHGITDALRDAELLVRALLQGTDDALHEYEATRLDLSRRLFELTDEIASLAWTDDQLQELHRAFSAEMSREVRMLASLDASDVQLQSVA
jgi:2-polyprenyl-6-methoxyphenol hydroxylase-like FAD-dependent oxidoreductase